MSKKQSKRKSIPAKAKKEPKQNSSPVCYASSNEFRREYKDSPHEKSDAS